MEFGIDAAIALALLGAASQGGPERIEGEVAVFLRDHYGAFELSERDPGGALQEAGGGLAADFEVIFYAPKKPEFQHYDRAGWLKGLEDAFALHRGKRPVMRVSELVVLPRGEGEAVAGFKLDLYLDGAWVSDALALADLRREGGRWKMFRVYEHLRR